MNIGSINPMMLRQQTSPVRFGIVELDDELIAAHKKLTEMLEKHPNVDRLRVSYTHGGFQVDYKPKSSTGFHTPGHARWNDLKNLPGVTEVDDEYEAGKKTCCWMASTS